MHRRYDRVSSRIVSSESVFIVILSAGQLALVLMCLGMCASDGKAVLSQATVCYPRRVHVGL